MFVCSRVCVFVCLCVSVFVCLCVFEWLFVDGRLGEWMGSRFLFVCRQADCAESHGQKQRVIEERAEMLAGMAWLRDIPG